ncbi:hypothetical protein NDU88_002452 [Pleurodeles waltl]|uniref:Uncharacterized protein n=1 Tax=Pleurodeles waltl TaxID=8319 RepID=A0AAV7MPF2_PLEWA|nr:hypothetical protein NDU88_002452 [Pleurodeles waltl]
MASSAVPLGPSFTDTSVDSHSETAMDSILQDITTVGRRLEAMDSKITDLATDSKSIIADIPGFQDKVTDLDQQMTAVEGRIAALPDNESKQPFL